MSLALIFRRSLRLLSLAGIGSFGLAFLAPAARAQSPSVKDGFDPNTNGVVNAAAVQSNGQVLIGGTFTTVQPNGATSASTANFMARLNADGSLDTTFNPKPNGQILAITVQANGQILIGGHFTTIQPNGASTPRPRATSSPGSIPTARSTRPSIPTSRSCSPPGCRSPRQVFAITLQSNGQILIGGSFNTLQPNGASTATTRNHLARLNSDGSLDTTFNPNVSATVLAITVQTNGQILIGGSFNTLAANGAATVTRNHVARLNADGSLDGGFDPNLNGSVATIVVQPTGSILLGGAFTTTQPNGAALATNIADLARVNVNGTLDTTFNPSPGSNVNALVLQADGKILVGGAFTQVFPIGTSAATTRNHLARLNPDGSLDTSFVPNANGTINALALQSDGRIVAGGSFSPGAGRGRRFRLDPQ